ncbi:hypothetical protein [Gynurincola endophyticus]|jgi:plasmid maintenance system killer protein|uniref:hypothetical protein n=1 Tax=Gynurincola endophyticus TaxID=2479004 RepID=UPI000F8D7322|nr:hypothetical protein [Gynurincola endophyticus]
MKKFAFILVATVFTSMSVLMAQPGGGQRMTVEQRVDNVIKEAKSLKLDAVKTDSVKAIFTEFYQTQQTQMEAIRNSGQRPDFETMRANNEKLSGERDNRLKAVLTADEWKQWEKKVAPSLNQRPGGGRPGGPGGPGGNF